MRRVIPISEHFQHFVENLKGNFWGDLHTQTRQLWKHALELKSADLPPPTKNAY